MENHKELHREAKEKIRKLNGELKGKSLLLLSG
jgi:hypothetical protein